MLNALYFPGVRPDPVWGRALSPLVAKLVIYGIAGETAAAAAGLPWESREVAPLGGDAPRFQALVREMTGRDAAMLRGQLLAMASRPGRDRDEASGWSLAGALHQMGAQAGEDLARARAERIWQARLFLQLAEVVSAAEEEISQGLAKLAARQAEILQALQGEDNGEEPAETLPVAPRPLPRPERIFRLRDQLAAWAVFYLQDPASEPLLFTDDPEAAALLADAVEKLAPGRVLALPDLALELKESEVIPVAKALQEMLAGKVGEGRAALEILAESQLNSRESLTGGGLVVRLYLLPGAEFRRAMAELGGLPGEDGATALASPYVLVGAAAPGEAYL